MRPARFRILRLALVSCPTNTFEMVRFVPEQPPTALSSLSSASVPLSRRKGVRGIGHDHTPVNSLCSPFPPWKGGEGDRTWRNSYLKSPSPSWGRGQGLGLCS